MSTFNDFDSVGGVVSDSTGSTELSETQRENLLARRRMGAVLAGRALFEAVVRANPELAREFDRFLKWEAADAAERVSSGNVSVSESDGVEFEEEAVSWLGGSLLFLLLGLFGDLRPAQEDPSASLLRVAAQQGFLLPREQSLRFFDSLAGAVSEPDPSTAHTGLAGLAAIRPAEGGGECDVVLELVAHVIHFYLASVSWFDFGYCFESLVCYRSLLCEQFAVGGVERELPRTDSFDRLFKLATFPGSSAVARVAEQFVVSRVLSDQGSGWSVAYESVSSFSWREDTSLLFCETGGVARLSSSLNRLRGEVSEQTRSLFLANPRLAAWLTEDECTSLLSDSSGFFTHLVRSGDCRGLWPGVTLLCREVWAASAAAVDGLDPHNGLHVLLREYDRVLQKDLLTLCCQIVRDETESADSRTSSLRDLCIFPEGIAGQLRSVLLTVGGEALAGHMSAAGELFLAEREKFLDYIVVNQPDETCVYDFWAQGHFPLSSVATKALLVALQHLDTPSH